MTLSRFLPALPNVPHLFQFWPMKGAVFGAALLLAPLAHAQRATSSEWFPLEVGTSWVYQSLDGTTLNRQVLPDPAQIPGRVVVEDEIVGADGVPLDSYQFVVRVRESTGMWITLRRDRPSSRLSPCPIPRRLLATASCQGEETRRLAAEGEGPVWVGSTAFDRPTLTYASATGFGIAVYAQGIGPVVFNEGETVYVLEFFGSGGLSAQGPAGLASGPTVEGVSVWPTPTTGPLTLQYATDADGPLVADVLDMLGRRILEVPLPSGPGTQTVRLDLPPGTGATIVRVRSETGVVGTARTVRVR